MDRHETYRAPEGHAAIILCLYMLTTRLNEPSFADGEMSGDRHVHAQLFAAVDVVAQGPCAYASPAAEKATSNDVRTDWPISHAKLGRVKTASHVYMNLSFAPEQSGDVLKRTRRSDRRLRARER